MIVREKGLQGRTGLTGLEIVCNPYQITTELLEGGVRWFSGTFQHVPEIARNEPSRAGKAEVSSSSPLRPTLAIRMMLFSLAARSRQYPPSGLSLWDTTAEGEHSDALTAHLAKDDHAVGAHRVKVTRARNDVIDTAEDAEQIRFHGECVVELTDPGSLSFACRERPGSRIPSGSSWASAMCWASRSAQPR